MLDNYMNSNGYDLYNPFCTNVWVIDMKNGNAFYGTLKEVIFYMTDVLDFDRKEIKEALNIMADHTHNSAHFGINQTFIYSFQKEIDLNEKAS